MENRKTVVVCGGGTRGDQQPVAMTGAELKKKYGYHIVLCCGIESKGWADSFGFEFLEIASIKKVVTKEEDVIEAAETGNFQQVMSSLARATTETAVPEAVKIYERCQQEDVVALLVTPLHFPIAEILARKLEKKIYTASLFFTPLFATEKYPPLFIDTEKPSTWKHLPGPNGEIPGPFAEWEEYDNSVNAQLWAGMLRMCFQAFYQSLKNVVGACGGDDVFTETCSKILCAYAYMEEYTESQIRKWNGEDVPELKTDFFLAMDEHVIQPLYDDLSPKQKEFFTGYIFDVGGSSLAEFPKEVEEFLEAEEPPIYFGWGSMCRKKNDELVRAAIGACIDLGKRGVILRGWANLSLDLLDPEEDAEYISYAKAGNIMFLGPSDLTKLLPKCLAIVMHGGAGTTAVALRSGRPSITTPVWWDQTWFGDRMTELELGARGPHFSQMSRENLGELLKEILGKEEQLRKMKEVRECLLERELGQVRLGRIVHTNIEKNKQ